MLILTHHYPPEVGAPQTRLSETAVFLKSRGHDVSVVTALPSYPTGVIPPSYRGRVVCAELIDAIPVVRTWTYAKPGSSARLRLANQLSFALSAPLALARIGKRDVVLVESPPLFLGPTGALFARLLRAPLVLHVSDLWPAVPIQLGALRNHSLIWMAERFERIVYALAERLIVVTQVWADQLVSQGVPAAKISLVTNGADPDFLDPAASAGERERLRSELALEGNTAFICLGTVSTVYDYELILRAAKKLAARSDLRFLIVGDGSQAPMLRDQVAELGLSNVRLLRAQPRQRARGLLAAADISMTPIRPLPVTAGQLPVRVLEAMAMARPVLLAGRGEARKLVEESGAGIAVDPGDAEAFTEALVRLSSDAKLRDEMGARGREAILARFSRSQVAEGIERALLTAVGF
ncbi:MAG TPA: glycosyltransferase family 4 protein [Chloroflexota bacterium]|nr:glycosyltransferase family 4 protein [Chloroflexota bacterium]